MALLLLWSAVVKRADKADPAVGAAPSTVAGQTEAEPAEPVSLIEQAHRHLKAGRVDEADAAFAAALLQDPRSVVALLGLAQIARWNGDFETAYGLLQEASALLPGNKDIRAELKSVEHDAARLSAARWGPTLPLVFGVAGFSILIGYADRRITLRTYAALTLYVALLVGLALAWLYLVPLD